MSTKFKVGDKVKLSKIFWDRVRVGHSTFHAGSLAGMEGKWEHFALVSKILEGFTGQAGPLKEQTLTCYWLDFEKDILRGYCVSEDEIIFFDEVEDSSYDQLIEAYYQEIIQ